MLNNKQKRKGYFMYLTEDEFLIFSAYKMGLTHSQTKEKLGITIYTNDTRVGNLCKKYGVNGSKGLRMGLIEKADMKKMQVCKKDEIPYYQYENNGKFDELVHKIKITKNDVLMLAKYFEAVEDAEQEFELISYDDYFNFYNSLEIKNLKTGEKGEICNNVSD